MRDAADESVVPYLALLALMFLTIQWKVPYWITLLMAVPAGALLLQSSSSFMTAAMVPTCASPTALKILGNVLGVLTFTPFADGAIPQRDPSHDLRQPRQEGIGDVWT